MSECNFSLAFVPYSSDERIHVAARQTSGLFRADVTLRSSHPYRSQVLAPSGENAAIHKTDTLKESKSKVKLSL
jgi:hypothetical protein